jgi:hypothetical protein
MGLDDIEREMARLDAVYRPVATRPIDISELVAVANLGASIEAEVARLGVADQAEALLRNIIELYATGDDPVLGQRRCSSGLAPAARGGDGFGHRRPLEADDRQSHQ